MPIYERQCDNCLCQIEFLETFEESEIPKSCPKCYGNMHKIPSVCCKRMGRIYDNAEYGPRAFFGGGHAKHEEWKELAEESEMVQRKREELVQKRELNDFVFEQGKYATGTGEPSKTIDEI